METKTFEQFQLESDFGASGGIHYRYPVAVLQGQFSTNDRQSIISNPYFTEIGCHPMNSYIGNGACRTAENVINIHSHKESNWGRNKTNDEDSFIGPIQVFIDKFKPSLKAGSLSFYPLHIAALSFIEGQRREHISKN